MLHYSLFLLSIWRACPAHQWGQSCMQDTDTCCELVKLSLRYAWLQLLPAAVFVAPCVAWFCPCFKYYVYRCTLSLCRWTHFLPEWLSAAGRNMCAKAPPTICLTLPSWWRLTKCRPLLTLHVGVLSNALIYYGIVLLVSSKAWLYHPKLGQKGVSHGIDLQTTVPAGGDWCWLASCMQLTPN